MTEAASTHRSETVFCCLHSDLLSMPVIYLMDVPEDDFVFALHVLGDALLLDLLLEALRETETCAVQFSSVSDDKPTLWLRSQLQLCRDASITARDAETETRAQSNRRLNARVSPPPRCPGL